MTNDKTIDQPNQEAHQLAPEGASVTRRAALVAGVAGTAGVALAACSSGGDSAAPSTSAGSASPSSISPSASATPTGTVIADVSDIPKGGATITGTSGDAYVVSQTDDGKIACFSAVCPHEGCLCNRVQGEQAVCPCHGSTFDVFTGAVNQGPAQSGLAKVETTVSNGKVIAK